ncbi:MAG: hypothetical protein ACOC56_06100, partial [Atribacterota bacterium]
MRVNTVRGVIYLTVMNKNQSESKKELIIIIHQDGFELDWQLTKEKYNQKQIQFQQHRYQQYRKDTDDFLFSLGFQDESLITSASLRFIYHLASNFINKLTMTPDLELLREKISVALDKKEIEKFINNAPYMT